MLPIPVEPVAVKIVIGMNSFVCDRIYYTIHGANCKDNFPGGGIFLE